MHLLYWVGSFIGMFRGVVRPRSSSSNPFVALRSHWMAVSTSRSTPIFEPMKSFAEMVYIRSLELTFVTLTELYNTKAPDVASCF